MYENVKAIAPQEVVDSDLDKSLKQCLGYEAGDQRNAPVLRGIDTRKAKRPARKRTTPVRVLPAYNDPASSANIL